ncbi:universal stress protein [Streptomyces ficellus]|uniref:Universal stress protein n=1 Tax=Streptomyces ficellus TaxID=1977088 RepID=A0A6I6FM64_9ACTN|nr:universal stress protein [Streptomyces ficellus]QGV77356.1 universal stress protein [Streptomyces ficellus]
MTRTVTVGIDGSRESLAAVEWAAGEALSRARLLRVVHAWSTDVDVVTRYVEPETQRRWAETLLHSAEERVRRTHPDVRLETSQLGGDPVAVLTEEGERADLLVLGSRGIGGMTGFIAGSVSLAVLARAQRPVVLVRAPESEETESARRSGDVVLGLDLPVSGEDVLAFAFGSADRYGCGLRIVHSWTLPPSYGPNTSGVLPMLLDEVGAEQRKQLEAAVAPWTEKYPGVPVSTRCRQGHPAQDLVETAAEADSRLIVVGLRRRHSRLGGHIGPVVHSVLHHSAAPVAVIPHE